MGNQALRQPARMSPRGEFWTDERVAILRKLHAEGKSGGEIAKALGGITRNAAIGKAFRMGLGPLTGHAASAPKGMAPKPAAKAQRHPRAPKLALVVKPSKHPGPLAVNMANKAAKDARRPTVKGGVGAASTPLQKDTVHPFSKPWIERKGRECMWILEPTGHAFALTCCAPTDEGAPWCPAHRARAYNPVQPKRRDTQRLERLAR